MKIKWRRLMGWMVLGMFFGAMFSLIAQTKKPDWNVAALDKILDAVAPGQKLARVGDMEILVSNLRAWRNQLAGNVSPNLSFDGTTPIWTGGNLYYTFEANVSAANQKVFLDSAKEWATFANLHFIPRTIEPNYFTVVENPSLASSGQSALGMVGGQQFLQIGPTAWNHGTICHELGHTLGLIHEHQRSDRDSFVTILTNNIIPGGELNFIKLSGSQNQGEYDFLSVMHYARNTLSIDPSLNTVEPLPAYNEFLNVMGQGDPLLTPLDRIGMAATYGAGPIINSDVTNTQDSEPGSFRTAIYYAFDHPGTTITFHIPTSDPGFSNGVFNIQPTDQLPSLWNATLIDGGSEPTNSNPSGPEILLNGALTMTPSVFAHGLHFRGTNCAVGSLTINGFPGYGVLVDGTNAKGNAVVGCFLGVDSTGNIAVTNGISPVAIGNGASSNFIGGTIASGRNIISGSASQGVVIRNPGTKNNIVRGNYIGLNAAGNAALPNNYSGIAIFDGAQSNIIGGTLSGERNVVSGNNSDGVAIFGTNTSGNLVQGNYIGIDPSGAGAIPNSYSGIDIYGGAQSNVIGGTLVATRNVISGNSADGIGIFGTNTIGNQVQGNYIGLNAAGTGAISNTYSGVDIYNGAAGNVVGGEVAGAGNVISGNGSTGININGLGTVNTLVQGNLIGVTPDGLTSLPNTYAGVVIFFGAQSNLIGGTLNSMRNIISGNGGDGVDIIGNEANHNRVQGNIIGLDVSGTVAISNTYAGVSVSGGAQFNLIGGGIGSRNFISGNGGYGVAIIGTNTVANKVQGNTMGLDVLHNSAVPNPYAGVALFGGAQSNLIGGLSLGDGNLIASNSFGGVYMSDTATTNNSVRANSIFGNGGNGIDLYSGANHSLSAPTLTSVTMGTNLSISVQVSIPSEATYHLDFYANPMFLAQGKVFIGTTAVTTEDLGGTFTVDIILPATIPANQLVTVTATDAAGNTSPFSSYRMVTLNSSANDGIPDAWRTLYFGSVVTNNQSCAMCDPDGDGANNFQEFSAGTIPTNAASAFGIETALVNGNETVVILPSVEGTVYRLESRDDLNTNSWSVYADQILGTGGILQITDPTAATFPRRFYRGKILP